MHSFALLYNHIFSKYLLEFCQKQLRIFKKKWSYFIFQINLAKFSQILANLWQKVEIAELCKGVHCVDIGESFQTHISLQNLASIQPARSELQSKWRSPSSSRSSPLQLNQQQYRVQCYFLFVPLRYLQFLKIIRYSSLPSENESSEVCQELDS